jgi:hypothetical protein
MAPFIFSIDRTKGLELVAKLISEINPEDKDDNFSIMELGLDDDDDTYFTEADDISTIPLERIVEARVCTVSFRALKGTFIDEAGVIHIYANFFGSILEEREEGFVEFVYNERLQAFVFVEKDHPKSFYQGEAPYGINCNSQAIVLDFSFLTGE